MAERLLITGALPHGPTGTPFPRLEVTAFVAPDNIKQFSLYIQALRAIYERPASETAAFYQLGGIHGRPYVDWNGSPANGRGFCVHNTERFPTWHRTVTVLFEQEVQKLAIEIAGRYPQAERAEWQSLAQSLRQPYWGWDNEATFIPPPELISLETVQIITPTGRQSVPNPLLGYSFRAGETETFPAPFTRDSRTLRSPDTRRSHSQPRILVAELERRRNDIIRLTRQLYSVTDFATFHRRLENDGHARIHAAVGGVGGHMDSVPVSGFDIAFFFLHSQVDRILTLWHSIHRVWPTGGDALPPFWRNQTNYWLPVDIRDTRTFSYSYPTTLAIRHGGEDIYEWAIRIKVNPFDVGGSFSVLFFFGNIPDTLPTPIESPTDPTFAGIFDVFSNSEPDECPNCQEHRDTLIEGHVLLNEPLVEKAKLLSLEEDVVQDFLKAKLNWAVQKGIDGTLVKLDDTPSLEVTIERQHYTLPVGAEYPIEGKPKFYHGITHGKKGGYSGAI